VTDGGGGRTLDVFVSCAQDGLGWAEWIAATLKSAGREVRLGAWDVVPGTHRVAWLDGVTRQARQTIAVVSDGYVDSPLASAEWGAAWSPRVLDGERRLLVARVTERPIPGLLGQIAPIDLAGRNELAARALLLTALGRGEAGAAGREASAGRAVFPGELPPVWNVPRPSAPFVGRTWELTRLDKAMADAPGGLVAVTGMAGIGKTSLAVEYVRARRADFDAVWWVPAGRPELLGERVRGLAPALGLPAHAEPAAVLARLDAADGRWLLVLDDATGPDALPDWLRPSFGEGRVLVTSRTDDWAAARWSGDGRGHGGGTGTAAWAGDGVVMVPMGPMVRAESVALLADRLPEVDRAVAGRIADQLGDHPLALDQAAHRIGRARAPAETYLAALVARPAVVLGQGEVPGRPGVTAATLWTAAIRRLDADAPAAGELLRLAAHGDGTTPLPLRLLTAPDTAADTATATATAPDAAAALETATARHGAAWAELRAVAGDPLGLADTVAEVERSGLAYRDGSALGMHVLVRTAVRADTTPEHAAQLVDSLGRMLHATLPERVTASPDAWPPWRELLPHALATLDATPPAADTPHTAWLAEHAAAYLTEHGHASTAEPLAARAVAAHERLHGPDHPDTFAARETHIRAALSADHLPVAGPLAERNAADRARVLGPDHPDTLTSRETLAWAYQRAGHLDHADDMLRRNHTDRARTLGPDHPATLESRHDLGVIHAQAGRADQAAAALRTTLTARDRVLGPDHSDTLKTHHHLAVTYQRVGATGDALAHAEPTLAARERVLGLDHPATLTSRHQLGVTYHQAGRLPDATRELNRALADRERILGPDHPHTLDSAQALANAHYDAGQTAEAIPLLDRALAGREHSLGPDHPVVTQIHGSLAAAHIAERRPGDAAVHMERILDRHERVLGLAHPQAMSMRDDLGSLYRAIGRHEAARHHLERQLTVRDRTDGSSDARTLRTATSLAEVYRQAGRLPEAVALNERVHTIHAGTLGPDHPDSRASRTTLADTYREAGRHRDALPLYRDAAQDALREHGPFHQDTISARRALSETLQRASADRPRHAEQPRVPETPPASDAGYRRLGP
jgi:tetratricopeptide (TPR) repeat protein